MTRKRRSFSTEFKHDAAKLILDQNYTYAEACRSLDVGASALRRWVDQLRLERGGGTPKSKALTPEQKRIQELEARVDRQAGYLNIVNNRAENAIRPFVIGRKNFPLT